VLPQARYVVADTFDALVDEIYPATFDGALAHTSLRVPWFAREHGETPDQQRCRTTWEQGGGAPRTLGHAELVLALSWCQTAELVARAVVGATDAASVASDLRRHRYASPLTSDLAPIGDDGYGPSQDAVLEWHADCACWAELEPFRDR
jgi:hypothetical protein